MDADQFRSWRKANHLKQKDAADLLGLKKRMIQYYEKGHRDGRKVKIPKSIRLACYAISSGVADFDGDRTKALEPGHDSRDAGHDSHEAGKKGADRPRTGHGASSGEAEITEAALVSPED